MKPPILMLAVLALYSTLTACASYSLPDNLDFIKLPEFREAVEELDEYPDVAQAPAVPTDVRTSAQWDNNARQMLRLRDSFVEFPAADQGFTDQEIELLKAQVRAYKLDDPPGL